jgi:predicted small secreted protein
LALRLAGLPTLAFPRSIFSPTGDLQLENITMKAIIAAIVGASFLMLGGCNTVEGAGKDVKAAGQKVEGEAAEHKKY